MADSKLIEPQIVLDCEFAGTHRDNQRKTLSFTFVFTSEELEEALDSNERTVFWNLEQGQPIRVSIQRIK